MKQSQSKRSSFIEAASHALIGVPIGFSILYMVGLLHLPPMAQAVMMTGLMFISRTLHGYWRARRFEQFARNIGNIRQEHLEEIVKRDE